MFIWKAADTTVAPFVCPGSGNYPVPGQVINWQFSCLIEVLIDMKFQLGMH